MATVARPRTSTVAAQARAAAPTPVPALGRYLNRELSTLQFHERILAQAEDETSPLLERTKFAAIFGPWAGTEIYVNAGLGFHSNDARGAAIRVDPKTGERTDPVTPLVRAKGAELGVRTVRLRGLQSTVALWYLGLDSELLFVGDAGVTEPSRASERRGVELGVVWNPWSWLIVDADLAWSRSRYSEADPLGDRIPGAVENVASLGIAIDHPSGWFGGARLRHFGRAPLVEDGTVESDRTTLVNLEAGYRFGERLKLTAAVFNAFDARDNDIAYFYESRLPGEATPVEDIHFHPVEPRTFRLTLTTTF